MAGFKELIEKSTRVVKPEEKVEEKKTEAKPEEKKPDAQPKPTLPVSETPAGQYSQADYEAKGEMDASTFSFCVESPLYAFNGIAVKLKKRKLKKELSGKELEDAIAKLEKTYEENKEIIEIEDDEFKHLQRIFTARAKLKGKIEDDPNMMMIAAGVAMIVRRVEILIPD